MGRDRDYGHKRGKRDRYGGDYGTTKSSSGGRRGGSFNPFDQEDLNRGDTDPAEMGFTDTETRHQFIRKVYAIVFAQLFFTFAIVAAFTFVERVTELAAEYYFVGLVSMGIALCVLMAISCGPVSFRRKVPINLGLLACFTLFEGVGIGFMVGMGIAGGRFSPETVAMAFGITMLIGIGFTAFAFQTRWDITKMGGVCFLLFIVFCIMSCVWAIVLVFVQVTEWQYNMVELVFASFGLLVFVGLLIYDTQLLLGGNHKYAISQEDYVVGAISIYLDIINIFIMLLRIISAAKGLQNSG